MLRITNPRAFQNEDDNTIAGITGEATTFSPLPIPAEYTPLDRTGLDVSSQDVAYLYTAYARDRAYGRSEASDFRDGVCLHHLIDRVHASSPEFSSRPTTTKRTTTTRKYCWPSDTDATGTFTLVSDLPTNRLGYGPSS